MKYFMLMKLYAIKWADVMFSLRAIGHMFHVFIMFVNIQVCLEILKNLHIRCWQYVFLEIVIGTHKLLIPDDSVELKGMLVKVYAPGLEAELTSHAR